MTVVHGLKNEKEVQLLNIIFKEDLFLQLSLTKLSLYFTLRVSHGSTIQSECNYDSTKVLPQAET